MHFNIIKHKDLTTNSWSGGTTTELFIYPPTSNYQKRDFDFRLSTATVEVEKSEFTTLQNVSRKLMILDGTIVIHHEGYASKQLNKFEVHEFLGDWKTIAEGTCTDFNLMTKGNINGDIKALTVENNTKLNFPISQNAASAWVFIYVYSGEISLDFNEEKHSIHKGDLISIKNPATLSIVCIENSELIITEIFL